MIFCKIIHLMESFPRKSNSTTYSLPSWKEELKKIFSDSYQTLHQKLYSETSASILYGYTRIKETRHLLFMELDVFHPQAAATHCVRLLIAIFLVSSPVQGRDQHEVDYEELEKLYLRASLSMK